MPDAVRPGDDGVVSHAQEQPVPNDTRSHRQCRRETSDIRDGAERTIQNHIVLIGPCIPTI